jgi:peptidoglycan LD-endopeptidase CwlK
MPSDLVKRIDLDLLYLPFLEKLLNVLARCRARGQSYYATRGTATWPEQAKLRELFLSGQGGKAAPAGYSAHNFGLAVDLCADSDPEAHGLQPSWDAKAYKTLGEEAQAAGLVWGASFNDSPHVQWPGYVSGADMAILRKIYLDTPPKLSQEQRLRAVWQYLDSLAGK